MFAMHPKQFPRRSIQSHHRPARSRRRINHAVSHQRRTFEIKLGTRTQVVGLESPSHLELAEIASVDLVERRVVRVPQVSAIATPLAVLSAHLSTERKHQQDQHQARSNHPYLLTTRNIIFQSAFICVVL